MSRWSVVALVLACAIPTSVSGQATSMQDPGPVKSPLVATFDAVSQTATVPAMLIESQSDFGVTQPQVRRSRGRTYMIAGVAALIGGLLIDGDVGTLIAAGGVVMGVYGILLYY